MKMKKNIKLLRSALFFTTTALLLISCDPKEGDVGVLKIQSDKSELLADGMDKIQISVYLNEDQEVTSNSSLYINDVRNSKKEFSTTEPGTYKIYATYDGVNSDTLTITANEVIADEIYERSVLMDDYTATWCGYCPLMMYYIKEAKAEFKNIIPVAIHNDDQYTFSAANQMMSAYSITGYPTVIINRDEKWDGNSQILNTILNENSHVALAVENTSDGSNLNTTIKVKFGRDFNSYMSLVVLFLQNNVKAAQTNYYNEDSSTPLYGLGNPIPDYEHNYILRKSLSALFGDEIPDNEKISGNIYEKTYQFDVSQFNLEYCEVVAFIATEEEAKKVINAQVSAANGSADFNAIISE